MSEQLLSLYGITPADLVDDSQPFATLPTRTDVLRRIKDNRNFDLLILGGGLTGAVVAHEAALQGIKVLLLEQGYFGSDALSWDVRIARQLRGMPIELLRARRALRMLASSHAPHLVAALPGDSHPISGVISRLVRRFVPLATVDERLLIRETILAARQEGAALLAGVLPVFLEAESAESGCFVVGFEDSLTQERYEARVGGVLVDPTHGVLPPSRLGSYVVTTAKPVSAGVQLIYQAVPKSAKGGLRFVSFELTDGSFVSVQRRGVAAIEVTVLWGERPLVTDQLVTVVADAVREAGWVTEREVSQRGIAGSWSAQYRVRQSKGVFTCSHRGAWDAFKSARTIVQTLVSLSREPRVARAPAERLLPGGEQHCEVDAFRALARAQGVSEQTIERVISRWRGRVRYLALFPNGLRELVPGVLRGEVELAVRSDQVISVDDLAVGALELQETPSWNENLHALKERLDAFSS